MSTGENRKATYFFAFLIPDKNVVFAYDDGEVYNKDFFPMLIGNPLKKFFRENKYYVNILVIHQLFVYFSLMT